MTVEWKDEYNTGEADIDDQHQVIFKYLADLEAQMEKGVDERYIKMLLDNLGLFTRSHFCYEEIYMRRIKSPMAAVNKEQHEKLLEEYGRYRQRFEVEGISDDLVKGLHDFIANWLINHILKVDIHMRD
ncbi:MAG: bacteriohemerythrin [Mariprofundaceae bacterium]|nr:bacteriohemerythrin [Mariprofundaceae bacterium]